MYKMQLNKVEMVCRIKIAQTRIASLQDASLVTSYTFKSLSINLSTTSSTID